MKAFASVVLCMSIPAAVGAAQPPQRGDDAEAMRNLAAESGCLICHRERPVPAGSDSVIAPAPSWREIAARYRGDAEAEERLTRIVVGGSDPRDRHWKNRAAFTTMLPNTARTTAQDARALVRWILSLR